jgi:hypothetical protein
VEAADEAVIDGNTLTSNASGDVVVRATITNGKVNDEGTALEDYISEEFTIDIADAAP